MKKIIEKHEVKFEFKNGIDPVIKDWFIQEIAEDISRGVYANYVAPNVYWKANVYIDRRPLQILDSIYKEVGSKGKVKEELHKIIKTLTDEDEILLHEKALEILE